MEGENLDLSDLAKLLAVDGSNHAALFETIDVTLVIPGTEATLRYHFLKFGDDNRPKLDALVRVLLRYIVAYALDHDSIPEEIDEVGAADLTFEALRLLRDFESSGEAGELLLYFLIEAVLEAPQLVAKLPLKTNRQVEVYGSDAIHARWNDVAGTLEVYFGEAKIYSSIYDALTEACVSIQAFHSKNARENDIRLLTRKFKHANEKLQEAVARYVDDTLPTGTAKFHHAVLIGFDWDDYPAEPEFRAEKLSDELRARYIRRAPALRDLLQTRLVEHALTHLRFEVFFLPFSKVEQFRKAFHERVFGR